MQLRFKSGDGEEELLGSRPKTVEDKLKHLTALLQKIEATNEEMESEKEAFARSYVFSNSELERNSC